jgi:hypothetical protein
LRPSLLTRIGLLALCGCATLALAQPKSDWELEQEKRDWKEGEVSLPALPKDGALIEFSVSAASRMKFFVDPQSLSVGADGVVRYTMVARSPAGAETVSYEGIRCASDTYRVYAFAGGEAWKRSETDWRPIEKTGQLRLWHNVLRSEYFCPLGAPIYKAAEGVDALRSGGHPSVKENRRY